jgi:DNA-binding HxlR family transcriptional regulator
VTRRTYSQYCGLARALDLVGERWTLLIVRDLAVAPRRFTDMLAGLPGVGTSLLSERLRALEEDGIIRRSVAARPARSVVYELTEDGGRLADAVAPLSRWGAMRLDATASDEFRPDWMAFTITSMFRAAEATGVHDCYEFRFGAFTLWVVIEDGTIEILDESPRQPDLIVTADVPTLAALGSGELSPAEAQERGLASYEGDPAAGERALRLLGAAASDAPVRRPRGAARAAKKRAAPSRH